MDNVLATRHGANEIGACMLPMGDYSIRYPVALGNIEALGHLKFRPDLCGHVLSVDCGNGVIEIIITNSNLGGGLDLYGSTWDRATGRKPPGITNCKVQLTNKNAFNFNGPRCYHATGEVNNPYYRNVGLLNTGGKIVSSALLNGIHGSHRGNNPYYAFDGLANPDQLVTFYFEDGSSYSVALRDCLNGNNKQFWS